MDTSSKVAPSEWRQKKGRVAWQRVWQNVWQELVQHKFIAWRAIEQTANFKTVYKQLSLVCQKNWLYSKNIVRSAACIIRGIRWLKINLQQLKVYLEARMGGEDQYCKDDVNVKDFWASLW